MNQTGLFVLLLWCSDLPIDLLRFRQGFDAGLYGDRHCSTAGGISGSFFLDPWKPGWWPKLGLHFLELHKNP